MQGPAERFIDFRAIRKGNKSIQDELDSGIASDKISYNCRIAKMILFGGAGVIAGALLLLGREPRAETANNSANALPAPIMNSIESMYDYMPYAAMIVSADFAIEGVGLYMRERKNRLDKKMRLSGVVPTKYTAIPMPGIKLQQPLSESIPQPTSVDRLKFDTELAEIEQAEDPTLHWD